MNISWIMAGSDPNIHILFDRGTSKAAMGGGTWSATSSGAGGGSQLPGKGLNESLRSLEDGLCEPERARGCDAGYIDPSDSKDETRCSNDILLTLRFDFDFDSIRFNPVQSSSVPPPPLARVDVVYIYPVELRFSSVLLTGTRWSWQSLLVMLDGGVSISVFEFPILSY
jgi:hypothetical protein